jgi:tRNA(fMet)-specific endonuclease VapC
VIFLLDTDTCIDALRHDPRILSRLRAASPDNISVASMTEAELWYGAWGSRDQAEVRRSVAAFLAPLARLPFDSEAAEHHAELRFALRAHPIGERDLIIASIAAAQGLALVTHKVREFSRVPALTVEDWIAAG